MPHTPGPWKVWPSPRVFVEGGGLLANPNLAVAQETGGALIAFVGEGVGELEEAANASLIAAGPDLLAALREADDFIAAEYETLTTGYVDSEAKPVLDQIRVALAKAVQS